MDATAILFLAAAFLTEIAGTLAGFGSSTLLLPLAVLFFDFKTALVLVVFAHIAGNLSRLLFFRQGIKLKTLWLFGGFSVVFSLIGALLVTTLSQNLLKGLLGIFLAVYALYAMHDGFVLKRTRVSMAAGGAASGFIAGLIGTGGALRGAVLDAFRLNKSAYIATSAAVSLAVDATRLPVYVGGGFLGQQFYWYLPVLFVLAVAGSFIGRKIVGKIPGRLFHRVVLAAVGLIGVYFALQWIFTL